MILLDTSGLLAAIDGAERLHEHAASALAAAQPPRLLSPFVLAELDYLIAERHGVREELSLLDAVASGVFRLEPFSERDVRIARDIIAGFEALDVGLADASIVVLSDRYGVRDVLTLDERHFRTLRGPGGAPFRLLPADAG